MMRKILLDFVVEHRQDILLLQHRFDFQKGKVLLVSVKSEGSMIEWEAKWLE